MRQMAKWAPRAAIAALLCAAAATAGCDGDEEERSPERDGPLVVYSSAPSLGPHAPIGQAFVAGARLALTRAAGHAGEFDLRYVPLESADGESGSTPEAALENAERASDDPAAIAYIGELDPATAAVSLPILNEAGIAQVGVTGLPAGLTRALPGSGAGEPERHYPTGVPHFVRIVPSEERMGAALARLMEAEGCTQAIVVARADGAAKARLRQMATALDAVGITVTADAELAADLDREAAAAVAEDLPVTGEPCLAAVRMTASQLRVMLRALGSQVRPFGDEWLVDPAAGENSLGGTLAVSGAARPPATLRGPARSLGPWGLYGYEAMSLVLDAVARAGGRGDERPAVLRALLATRARRGALGTYSINRHGDTTATHVGVWHAGPTPPRFVRRIEAAAPAG